MADISRLTLTFHNVEGVTIGERRKNFNKLLRDQWTISKEQIILDDLKPKTYLESFFYVDILIHLKQKSQLLELLREGHGTIVDKILRRKQCVLHEIFGNIDSNTLVNDLLPTLSYVVKRKLLKKLCLVWPDNKVDEVFDLILERDGLSFAISVLPGCSGKKIENILKNNEIQLRSKELIMLHKKQPSLIYLYANRFKTDMNMIFDNNFLTYISQKDTAFFWQLINKETFPTFKLGRRTTKKFVVTKGHAIITNPTKYIKYFRHETLVRKLNKQGQFKQLYYNIFPRDIADLDGKKASCNELLKYYPRRYQYDLFIQTFADVIREDIFNNIACIENSLLEIINDVPLRESLARLKYSKYDDVEYIKYFETEKCLSLIKEKLSVTSSVPERKKLLSVLIKSCAINKDLNMLEKVLQYFCEKHRNDDKTVRSGFLKTVEECFDKDELREAHWKHIKEIFTIQTLNKEYGVAKLRINHVKFLYESNGSHKEKQAAIKEYLENQIIRSFHGFDNITSLKKPVIEKDILLAAIEFLPTAQLNEYDLGYTQSEVLCQIYSYNNRYPEHIIPIFENNTIAQAIRRMCEKEFFHYPLGGYVEKGLCKLDRNKLDNEMLSLYLGKTSANKNRIFQWCLKNDPKVILDNIEKIVTTVSSKNLYPLVWSKLRLFSHLDLCTIAIKCCLKQLDDRDIEGKIGIIKLLSLLCTPEEYIKILTDRNLVPTSSKVELKDQESKDLYKLQQTFILHLKNLGDPLKFMDFLIEKCCRGDFLQASLPPLRCAFYTCAENKLLVYLDKLSTTPAVSVKKHSVHLSHLFDQETVLKIIRKIEKDNTNVSLQKHVFSSTLRFFSKNPNDQLFKIITSLFVVLKAHDTESLNLLLTINIPSKYKPEYILNVWNLLERFKVGKFEGNNKFNASLILDLIDSKCIEKLPQSFCAEIIGKLFLKMDNKHTIKTGILPFIIKYLVYRSETNSNYELVFGILKNFKSKTWNKCNPKERNTINTFFMTYYTMVCEKKLFKSVSTFSYYWKNAFNPLETFEETILLSLLELESNSQSQLEIYSSQLVSYAEKIYADFGQIVFPKFITILSNHLTHLGKNNSDLLYAMLKYKPSIENCILIIELINLKGNLIYKDKIRPIYQDIDAKLRDVPDPNVQLYYNLYLKSKSMNK